MSLELRPTFTTDFNEACTLVAERLRDGLAREPVWTKWARVPGARQEASCAGNFVLVSVPAQRQRFWSPWLQISILPYESAEAGTQLFGRFSPRPAVWTAFALSYLLLGCLAFFGSMYGMSQLILGEHPWALWVTLASLIAIVLLWWASQLGKRLADEQMRELRQVVERAMGVAGRSDGAVGSGAVGLDTSRAAPTDASAGSFQQVG